MVAKAFLIMRGKVNELEFPHQAIIPLHFVGPKWAKVCLLAQPVTFPEAGI
jgi:hypothetical protein